MSRLSISKYYVFLSILMVCFSSASFAEDETGLEAGLVNPGYEEKPDWFKVSFLDLYEDVADAAAHDRRLMLFFYQDGCPYCKKLIEDNFGQRSIAQKTQKYFDVVTINIWGDREVTVGDRTMTEKQFAAALKIQYTPTLLFFNKQNKVVFRANGYYPPEKFSSVLDYVGQKQETKIKYLDYVAKHPVKQPSTGVLHTEVTSIKNTHNLKAALQPGKHLLVMFEQNKCKACDELHLDILKRKESRDLLRRLNVVVLDMWSESPVVTPDGTTMSVNDWAKKLGIEYAPSLVYFNDTGKEVFRSDAYLKAFHLQSGIDYVVSNAYKTQPNFQRYINERAEKLREHGVTIDIMK